MTRTPATTLVLALGLLLPATSLAQTIIPDAGQSAEIGRAHV